MSELLKIYVQASEYIPRQQLEKLNINLLKTYYKNNERDIKNHIFVNESYPYINMFYKVLDDNDKNNVLIYLQSWSNTALIIINDDILKDYCLRFTKHVKNRLKHIDLSEKYSLSFAVKIYRYLDSKFLKKFEDKVITYYDKKSETPWYEYFAKSFIELLKKIGIKEYLDNYVNYDYVKNTNNYDSLNDTGKRINFLSHMINDFYVYTPEKLLKYIDVMNERDMTEIIKHNYTNNRSLRNKIGEFPIEFYLKFPKVFLNLINKHEEFLLESNIPKEFMMKYGLYEKYEKFVDSIAQHAWKKIKKDEFESGFIPSRYDIMYKISYFYNYIKDLNISLSMNITHDIKVKINDYFEKENLNLK